MKVHSIGDSHSSYCFKDIEEGCIYYSKDNYFLKIPFLNHYVGSKTMHSFGLKGVDQKNFNSIEKGDYVVFCFGEIDVRCHIYNQVHIYGRGLDLVIKNLVDSFIARIKEIESSYKIHPIIFGVIPPVKEITVDGYPSIGPYQERVKYTKFLNFTLEINAKKFGINYFDVFDEYCLEDGSLNMNYSDGIMHISQEFNGIIKNKLFELITKAKS